MGALRCILFVSDCDKELVQFGQALYDFIHAHGTSGVIPSSTAIKQTGWSNLDQAISNQGICSQYAVHT